MRGATTLDDLRGSGSLVSIHAPRVGRDDFGDGARVNLGVSIHAPRVGRDLVKIDVVVGNTEFQSTRPVWGATSSHCIHLLSH